MKLAWICQLGGGGGEGEDAAELDVHVLFRAGKLAREVVEASRRGSRGKLTTRDAVCREKMV